VPGEEGVAEPGEGQVLQEGVGEEQERQEEAGVCSSSWSWFLACCVDALFSSQASSPVARVLRLLLFAFPCWNCAADMNSCWLFKICPREGKAVCGAGAWIRCADPSTSTAGAAFDLGEICGESIGLGLLLSPATLYRGSKSVLLVVDT
jgi:hypothetical protein